MEAKRGREEGKKRGDEKIKENKNKGGGETKDPDLETRDPSTNLQRCSATVSRARGHGEVATRQGEAAKAGPRVMTVSRERRGGSTPRVERVGNGEGRNMG